MQFFKRNLYDIKGLKKWRMRFRIPTPIAGITSTLTLSGEKVMAICGENTTDAPTSVKTQERTKTAWTHKSMRLFCEVRKRAVWMDFRRPEIRKEKQVCGSN